MRGKAIAVMAAMVLLVPFLPTGAAGQNGESFGQLGNAFEEAEDGDVLVLHAAGDSEGEFRGSITVDKDVDLCAGDVQSQASITLASSLDACTENPGVQPIIDASNRGTHVLKINHPGINVQDIELRWTVDLTGDLFTQNLVNVVSEATSAGLVGVNVAAEDVKLLRNTVHLKSGPCVSTGPFCQSPVPALGISLGPDGDGALVEDNVVEVSHEPGQGTISGKEGIHVAATDYTIRENTVRGWVDAGIAVTPDNDDADSTDDPVVEANTLELNPTTGLLIEDVNGDAAPDILNNRVFTTAENPIHVRDSEDVLLEVNKVQLPLDPAGSALLIEGSDHVDVLDNDFRVFQDPVRRQQPGVAVTITAGAAGTPEDIDLNDNFFELAAREDPVSPQRQFALEITADVQLTVIDAVSNDWGVYTYDEVASRVLDQGVTNEVIVTPFDRPSDGES